MIERINLLIGAFRRVAIDSPHLSALVRDAHQEFPGYPYVKQPLQTVGGFLLVVMVFLASRVITAPVYDDSQCAQRRNDITLLLAHDSDMKLAFDITKRAVAADGRINNDLVPSKFSAGAISFSRYVPAPA